MFYSASRHVSFVAMLLFLCSLIFTNYFFHNYAPTLLKMLVYMYTQYMVLDVFLITGPRMEDSTAPDLKSSISCVMNKWAIIVCLTYLSTTPLCCTVPCMLCRHVLVVVTTERSSVPATMSPSERRIIHGSFTIVSARG